MYYTYVLYSDHYDRIYIGQTNNLNFRVDKHNFGLVKSTKHYAPWRLVHYETFRTRSQAMGREKYLKSHIGRDYIRKKCLISRVRRSRINH